MKRTVLLAGFLIVAVILLAGAWIAVPQVLGSESSSAELLSGTSFRGSRDSVSAVLLSGTSYKGNRDSFSADLLSGTSFKGNR